jgi:hypothetical protein
LLWRSPPTRPIQPRNVATRPARCRLSNSNSSVPVAQACRSTFLRCGDNLPHRARSSRCDRTGASHTSTASRALEARRMSPWPGSGCSLSLAAMHRYPNGNYPTAATRRQPD